MTRLLSILLTTTILTTLLSCSKGNGNEEETDTIPTATLTFSSPAPNAVYTNGDVVAIKAKAISMQSMHGYDMAIRKVGDASNIYFTHIHDHNDTINIYQSWKTEVTTLPANLEAEITLYLDHDGHTQKGKVAFGVQ